MRHRRKEQNRARARHAGVNGIVPAVQTKPTKALVALVVTLAGLVGIHLTNGTAQLVVMVAQLVIVSYGVWRARNAPKGGPGVGEFL